MPCISSCPACHRDLTVADYADNERRLRCPLCSAEFSAAEILADGVPFPPAAIDVEATLAVQPEAPAAAQQESFAGETAVAPGESADVAENHQPAVDEIESEAPPEADLEHEEAAAEPGYSVRSVPRRKTKTSAIGMLGHVVGMALGGVLGLAIGYYVLLWIGGPQADFLELRAKLPAWMLPSKRAKRERPDARRGETDDHSHERSLADLLEEPDSKADESSDVSTVAFETSQSAAATSDSPTAPGNASFAENSSLGGADQDGQGLLNESAPESSGGTQPKDPGTAVGPRGYSAYSADDLGLALAKAGAAIGCEHCHATGYILRQAPGGAQRDPAADPQRSRCPHCHGKPIRGLTTEAFDRLCVLADAVTFAQLAPDEAERDRLREQLMAALARVADDRGKTQIIGRLAGARLDDSQRQTNGIILAGTVQSVAAEGPLYRIQIVLFGLPRSVVVYSRQAPQPAFSPADRVLILGSIVDSPSENLAGYQGRLTQVVWGGLPLKLVPAGQ